MSGKAKRQAARDIRKKQLSSARALKKAEYEANIAAGRNTKTAAKRLMQKRKTERKVLDVKNNPYSDSIPAGPMRQAQRYVKPSQYGLSFWS